MSVVLKPATAESRKKEQFIQIGKSRHRIANDHHSLLSEIQEDFREMTMEQLLFLTSFIGASLIQAFGPLMLRNVRLRAQAGEGRVNR